MTRTSGSFIGALLAAPALIWPAATPVLADVAKPETMEYVERIHTLHVGDMLPHRWGRSGTSRSRAAPTP